jgi:hypothetical protein
VRKKGFRKNKLFQEKNVFPFFNFIGKGSISEFVFSKFLNVWKKNEAF